MKKSRKIVNIMLPIVWHACSLSLTNLFSDGTWWASGVMLPDATSLAIVVATSVVTCGCIEHFRLRQPRLHPFKLFLADAFRMLVNLNVSELFLRMVWIPLQYLLYYAMQRQAFAVTAEVLLYGLKMFPATRPLLVTIIQGAKSEVGYVVARNVVAWGYLLVVICYAGYLRELWSMGSQQLERFKRRNVEDRPG